MLSKFKGTVKFSAVDPRFVVEFKLVKDTEGVGLKGEVIAFAIHSPARDLLLSDYSSSAGHRIRLKLLERQGVKHKRFTLRKAFKN